MSIQISLQTYARGKIMGIRATAEPIRDTVEDLLNEGSEVTFDFTGVGATQSFIDELVGSLVLRHGPEILERIVFKGCSPDVRAILRFVTTDRSDQFFRAKAFHPVATGFAPSGFCAA